MSDHTLRTCILNLLRLTKLHSVHLRRRCNDQWCSELRALSGASLERRLKYVIWWSPLRSIVTAHNRGLLVGQRVLMCVYEELRRRGLERVPCIRGIVEETEGKQCFLEKNRLRGCRS